MIPIEEIKSRIDLVEFINSYVRLQKAGVNFRANCPFHNEKSPSFYVSPPRQIWHCFGCGKGGDAFKFLMEIEGHDFPEALRLLADRAGVKLQREDPVLRSERNKLYDICEAAAKIFEKSFSLTPAVRQYIKGRGVQEESLKEFRVGFAPDRWDFLLNNLKTLGFREQEIEKAGLAIRSDEGSYYDRFRGRLTFPVTDAGGKVVGFGGRIFESESKSKEKEAKEAKYINTPNTLVYDKSRVLYGFDKAKHEIRTRGQVVVVEGYMDCLMSHQAGVKNTIAVSGTALTQDQLKILRRLAEKLISSFDTDAAGESATRRSLMLASEFGFECRVAQISSGKDPADAVRDNPAAWRSAVEGAVSVIDFFFSKALERFSASTPDGKKNIAGFVLPWIARLENEIERTHWIQELSKKIGVGEEIVSRELKKLAVENKGEISEIGEKNNLPTRKELLEERFLALLPTVATVPQNFHTFSPHLAFSSSMHDNIFRALTGDTGADQQVIANNLEILKFKGEVLLQSLPDPLQEFLLCKRELEKECVREKLLKLGDEISKLEKEGRTDGLQKLLQDFNFLSSELKIIS